MVFRPDYLLPLSGQNPRFLALNFEPQTVGPVRCKEELGGIIKSYYREAA